MDCPKCIGRLQPFKIRAYKTDAKKLPASCAGTDKISPLELDKCFVCGGIWFDKGELRKLALEKVDRKTIASKIEDPKLYKQLNEKGGLCPRCEVPMKRIKGKKGLKNVAVDICGKCSGVWLDGGEVNHILPKGAVEGFMNLHRFFRNTKHNSRFKR